MVDPVVGESRYELVTASPACLLHGVVGLPLLICPLGLAGFILELVPGKVGPAAFFAVVGGLFAWYPARLRAVTGPGSLVVGATSISLTSPMIGASIELDRGQVFAMWSEEYKPATGLDASIAGWPASTSTTHHRSRASLRIWRSTRRSHSARRYLESLI